MGASSLLGATSLMNPYLIRRGMEAKKIEEDLIDGASVAPSAAHGGVNYEKEIERLAEELGIDFSSGDLKAPPVTSSIFENKRGILDMDAVSIKSGGSRRSRCSHCTAKEEAEIANLASVSVAGAGARGSVAGAGAGARGSVAGAGARGSVPALDMTPVPMTGWTPTEALTEEQEKKMHMTKVIQTMRGDTRTAFTNEAERDQSDKISKLEQIDGLKASLQEEGEDVSAIPSLTVASSTHDIDTVLTRLLMKSNRTRYSTIASEVVSALAEGVESFFDGTRAIPFVGWKPDYTGYQNTVIVKLNRMKFETSQVVGSVLDGRSISPWARILMELVPSFLLYPRTRAKQVRPSHPRVLSSTSSAQAFNSIRGSEDTGNSWKELSDI